jgi:hypothetical protein
MMEARFQSWLEQKYPPPVGTATTRLNNCKRVEESHGDLDEHYDEDRMSSLLNHLAYSTEDKSENRANPSHIHLYNCDLYNNLAMYRSAIKRYREFREYDGKISTRVVVPTLPRIARSWPAWGLPSNEDLLRLTRITVPYIRFLHPDIVRAVVDDNRYRSDAWSSRLAERGIRSALYLWESSACAFPGVRRYAGSTEIAQHRRRLKVTADPENALELDDNDYPKAIWSFVFRGEGFKNEGPSGYSLAHLADHKKYKNRAKEEFDINEKEISLPTFYGLFTSAANTVYMPTGLVRPTDFSFSLRNLMQRKAAELYGSFCKLLPPGLSIRAGESDAWSLDAFQWREPVGTLAHVPAFLTYRNDEMEKLLSNTHETQVPGRESAAMKPPQPESPKQHGEPQRRRWWNFG